MEEKEAWGSRFYTFDAETARTFHTSFQKVNLITNPVFGRMLFLDGILQSASSDEHIYHDALVKVGMKGSIEPVRRVLIGGGAEGAVLREVYAMGPHVKEAIMVDWDKDLVEDLRKNETMNERSFDDERTKVYYVNILKFVVTTPKKFHAIFLDLLDPSMESVEWLENLVNQATLKLTDNGILTMNLGGNAYIAMEFLKRLHVDGFGEWYILPYKTFVPSFHQEWYFLSMCRRQFKGFVGSSLQAFLTIRRTGAEFLSLDKCTIVTI
jgi:spermidine synthase